MFEDGRIRLEVQNTGVELEGHAASIAPHIRGSGEGVGEVEELVEITHDERVGIKVDEGLDADFVERPKRKLGELVAEVVVHALAAVWWGDSPDWDGLESRGSGEAQGGGRHLGWEVQDNHSSSGARFLEGVTKRGHRSCIGVVVQGRYDRMAVIDSDGAVCERKSIAAEVSLKRERRCDRYRACSLQVLVVIQRSLRRLRLPGEEYDVKDDRSETNNGHKTQGHERGTAFLRNNVSVNITVDGEGEMIVSARKETSKDDEHDGNVCD